jgi:hypothetical protein
MEAEDVEEPEEQSRPTRRQQQIIPTFEIEQCDDLEESAEELSSSSRSAERRKVPPLRIMLTKNGGEDKNLSPSSSSTADRSETATPNRKRPARKPVPATASEKKAASSTRVTRASVRQT